MFDKENNVEQILKEDNRHKKRNGYGIFHRAPRTGGARGGGRTPYFMLTGKARQEYIEKHTGEVVSYYMDEKDISLVKPIAEIEAMPFKEARDYIIRIKNAYTAKQLLKHWGYKSDYHLYQKLYKKYEVPTDKERLAAARAAIQARKQLDEQYESTVNPQTITEPKNTSSAATAASRDTITEPQSLTVTLSGVFTGEEVKARLNKLAEVVDSSASYKVFISISE